MEGGEREKHQCEKDTLIGCLPHTPRLGRGIKLATQVRALDQ